MKTTRTTAVDISIFCKLNRPTSVPSVTPMPPGKNETAPKINDDVYVMIRTPKSNGSMFNANITR